MELTLPARAYLRYNVSPYSILIAGYEIEGAQYLVETDKKMFLQRGEIKPRIQLEQKLWDSFWLTAQAGLRINGRFDVMKFYDSKTDAERLLDYKPPPAFYGSVSLSLVNL